MPPPVTDNWEAVKATAIALNDLKRAAEQHGVAHDAVRQRARREGWPVGRRVAKMAKEAHAFAHAQLAKVSPQAVTSVTSTADALSNVMLECKGKTRVGLAAWSAKSAGHLGTLEAEEALAAHQAAAGVATVMTKLWPESGPQSVRISMFAQSQVVDIEAEVMGREDLSLPPANTEQGE